MTDTSILNAEAIDDPAFGPAIQLIEAKDYAKVVQLVRSLGENARAPTLNAAGVAANVLKAMDLAESFYRRALAIEPGFVATYNNLGLFLRTERRVVEAESVLHAGLRVQPDEPVICMAVANLLWLQERYVETEVAFRELIDRHPDDKEAQFRLGALLLSLGRFEEGWPLYEARHDPKRPGAPERVQFAFPQWRGEPLAGKSILVWLEQGFGDEIQFSRYFPLLKAAGAARVTVVCKPALEPLLATIEGVDRLVPAEGSHSIEDHDYWSFLMSLPGAFGTTLESVPNQVPYIHVPPERRTRWAGAIPDEGLRVGLVWKGNPFLANDAQRSVHDLATLRPLWDVPGVTFVSLQKGAGEDEAASPPADQPMLDIGSKAQDFADSAAIMDQLDLVIAVDTAAAHLAGALGKPCFCLIPNEGMDFRWLTERSDSPWYPTMRLFRRGRAQSWDRAVGELAAALAEFAAASRKGAAAG
ncbi:MAG TPA: hypothetical protein VIO94_00065 [Phenylobacterium sp.]